ncbi:CxxH/CxxC protein (TIGR04129 family) [Cytobacillus oceanisediminis]|uniref:CxxH/CxxC protein (TIGR04129 family) n=1 Tax=Cytobacillus oceanisediminis TaxID=665099 RepID=A0A2V2ZRR2_9BACI|nr:hypothetical protein DFO73_109204 [Cytobacillus oceanisediminis]TWH85805.1 hypothetical protein IQ19_02746 [Cytobacillus oceanisediminis]
MWVCNSHLKEVMMLLETPHIRKAPYQIKCSLCENHAFAKVYYTHRSFKFTKKLYSSLKQSVSQEA